MTRPTYGYMDRWMDGWTAKEKQQKDGWMKTGRHERKDRGIKIENVALLEELRNRGWLLDGWMDRWVEQ